MMKCTKFPIDEDERRVLKTKEDLIRKSEWVTLNKIQIS
jgi:RIO-like serine/threonine protein kinase